MLLTPVCLPLERSATFVCRVSAEPINMALHSISSSVGRNQASHGGNRPDDLASVTNALKSIPGNEGGAPELVADDEEALSRAIVAFQKRWWPHRIPDGVIQPKGETWTKIKYLLGETLPKEFKLAPQHKLFQGDPRWQKQNLNNSKDALNNIWTKGCLLMSLSCALAWKEMQIPADEVPAVKKLLETKNKDYAGNFSEINPATLDAWMTLNGSQGYERRDSVNLDGGRFAKILNQRGLIFYGKHTSDKTGYLKMPTRQQMERWVNDEWILIVRRAANQHHFLWVTGHDGTGTFSVWDVGYPAGNPNHAASVRVEDLDQVFRWGPPAKEQEAKK